MTAVNDKVKFATRSALWAAAAALALTTLPLQGAQPDTGQVDWPLHGLTADEQRYSSLDAINRETIGQLGLAWSAEFDTDRGIEATPIMVNGVIYATTSWSKVHAIDARTGKFLWSYDPKVPGEKALHACCDVVNRGAAVWQGKVYVGTLDGRLIALSAKTGKLLWQARTFDPKLAYTITGAPKVINGKVVIGNGGAEYGVRGFVTAYDANSGKLAWRFYLAPNPRGAPDGAASDEVFRRFAGATWYPGAWQQAGGGGTAWDSLTYDETNDLLLIGAGNGGPWNRDWRSGGKGDNLFLSSIVAVRPQTGKYVWHYQETPGDEWDYTATQHIMLADVPIAGEKRRVVMQAPKNGFFYVLDAKSGKLLSAEKYVPADWAEKVDLATGRPVEAPNARYKPGKALITQPGPLGGHNWQPMAFSPQTGLVYIPALIGPGYYSKPADPASLKVIPGLGNRGIGARAPGPPNLSLKTNNDPVPGLSGELIAWDPAVGSARWRLTFPEYWRSGVLASAGGLVFHAVGTKFTAFDAADGKVRWQYDTGIPAIAPAITYRLDGQQYVALLVGWGGAAALGGVGNYPRHRGRLLVFKLGGTAQNAPYEDVPIPPMLDLTQAVAGTGDVTRGRDGYVLYCQACHMTSRFLPNLPRSPMILEPTGFRAIVLDGALKSRGMPSFKAYASPEAVEDIRTFLLAEAAKQAATTTPQTTEPSVVAGHP